MPCNVPGRTGRRSSPWLVRAALALIPCFALLSIGEATSRTNGDPAGRLEAARLGIASHELARHLRFLASDEMRGRDTATPEAEQAAEYLARSLKEFGLAPAGARTDAGRQYLSPFPLLRTQIDLDSTSVELRVQLGEVVRTVHLTGARDFVFSTRGLRADTWDGGMVFVGAGTDEDYEGIDATGKFALVMERESSGEGNRRRGRFAGTRALRRAAEEAGALGLLVIHAKSSDQSFRQTLPWLANPGQSARLQLDDEGDEVRDRGLPSLYLENAARDFLLDAGFELDPSERGLLEGATARFTLGGSVERVRGNNVVGLLTGADDALAREVIVISAHYDHVGVHRNGDVYNGADDNASGTSAVLEIAQAFAEGPRPRRSVVFLWVSGEEKGLLGSRWWVDHPTLDDGYEIVGNVNLDMVGRNDPGEVSICPSPDHESHSTLARIAADLAKDESLTAKFDADQYFRRTDSYNFARKGIPIVFFHSGDHSDYHRTSDTVDKIDFDKATRIARVAYRVAFEAANADDRPRVVKPAADSKDDDGQR